MKTSRRSLLFRRASRSLRRLSSGVHTVEWTVIIGAIVLLVLLVLSPASGPLSFASRLRNSFFDSRDQFAREQNLGGGTDECYPPGNEPVPGQSQCGIGRRPGSEPTSTPRCSPNEPGCFGPDSGPVTGAPPPTPDPYGQFPPTVVPGGPGTVPPTSTPRRDDRAPEPTATPNFAPSAPPTVPFTPPPTPSGAPATPRPSATPTPTPDESGGDDGLPPGTGMISGG